MLIRYTVFHLVFQILLWSGGVLAEDTDTSVAAGGGQIIVSPVNALLDVSDMLTVNVLVLDGNGIPIKERRVQIVPRDRQKVSVNAVNTVTDESGYISFSILGKQQGNTVITVTDGVVSSQINIAIRDLIHYVLPYFYGDMQLSLINPSEAVNYVKILFHENSDRPVEPVFVNLESKEMKTIKLSEELDITLKDGWAEIHSTETVIGGVWTNKGYLPFRKLEE